MMTSNDWVMTGEYSGAAQDALGGNCRTSLVVCASPAAADVSESGGALGQRARDESAPDCPIARCLIA